MSAVIKPSLERLTSEPGYRCEVPRKCMFERIFHLILRRSGPSPVVSKDAAFHSVVTESRYGISNRFALSRHRCHAAGGELEQIQFLLGRVSNQTTER